MNLPNKLTMLRIILVPVFMLFAFPFGDGNFRYSLVVDTIVFFIFLVATLTDMADGKIARKYNLITDFGKFLDPIADKLLVAAALCGVLLDDRLANLRIYYGWALMIVLIREFVISGFRMVASSKGVVIAAGNLGKWKTATQTIGLCIVLGAPMLGGFIGLINGEIGSLIGNITIWIGHITMVVSVVLTIISGVEYIAKNATLLKGSM